MNRSALYRCWPIVLAGTLAGCSIKNYAINSLADGLAGVSTTFTSDDDVELVADALPFGLKLYESLLAETPDHRGLLLTTASGFTQYAIGFLQEEAFVLEDSDLLRARHLRARASKLCLRGRAYAFRGLELNHPGMSQALLAGRTEVLGQATEDDVAFLYWAGVSWAGALSVDKGDLDLVAGLPYAAALVERSLELDEDYSGGAAHEFLITYEGGRSDAMGGSAARAREHYRRALELSHGHRVSVHLALAESVAVTQQNLDEFRELIAAALAIDVDADPALRLANTIYRQRALVLQQRIADLFIEAVDLGPDK